MCTVAVLRASQNNSRYSNWVNYVYQAKECVRQNHSYAINMICKITPNMCSMASNAP